MDKERSYRSGFRYLQINYFRKKSDLNQDDLDSTSFIEFLGC